MKRKKEKEGNLEKGRKERKIKKKGRNRE